MDLTLAADLSTRADSCDLQVRRIDDLITDLSRRSNAIFTSLSGQPVTSLATRIGQQITVLRTTQDDFRAAAAALRQGVAAARAHPPAKK